MSRSRFEPSTSRIRVWSLTATVTRSMKRITYNISVFFFRQYIPNIVFGSRSSSLTFCFVFTYPLILTKFLHKLARHPIFSDFIYLRVFVFSAPLQAIILLPWFLASSPSLCSFLSVHFFFTLFSVSSQGSTLCWK
jgi:hypothetical protein